METFSINIAKRYKEADWRGLPAHAYEATLDLSDTVNEEEAKAHLEKLSTVYTWPEYHLTLCASEVMTRRETLLSTADPEFLKKHQWNYPSTQD